jgi:peptide chain release factor
MPVSSGKENAVAQRMLELGVSESDLEETFIRSSGPGGQKVNKTSSCVHLLHIPTGLAVKCQRERSQSLNRHLARRLLLDKIERAQKGFVEEERERIEKIRRQKRKRSKRAKEKILTDKHHLAEKKVLRGKVAVEE